MMGAMARDSHLAKDAMDALDAVWLSGDVPAILDCFEPELVFFGSGEGEEAVGHTELEAMLEMLAAHAFDRQEIAHFVIPKANPCVPARGSEVAKSRFDISKNVF